MEGVNFHLQINWRRLLKSSSLNKLILQKEPKVSLTIMFRDNNYVYLWNQDILNYNYHSLNGRCSPRTSCFIFAVLRKWSVTLAYVYKQSRHRTFNFITKRTFNFITKINTITKKPLSLFPARPDLFLNNRFLNKIQVFVSWTNSACFNIFVQKAKSVWDISGIVLLND